jgi:hypothetical protein
MSKRFPLTIVTLAILICWIVALTYFYSRFGSFGFGLTLAAVFISWVVVANLKSACFRPFNLVRPTIVEVVVVGAIGFILYGLSIPAVVTNCVGRRGVVEPAQVSTDVVQEDRR